MDLQLFERTHRGLILTKAGQSLYQDTKYIIQYCKNSVTRAKNAMQESDKYYSYWHISYDSGSSIGGFMAESTGVST